MLTLFSNSTNKYIYNN